MEHPWEAFIKYHNLFCKEGGPWPPPGVDGCPISEAAFAAWRAEFEAPPAPAAVPDPAPAPEPAPEPAPAPEKRSRRRDD